MPGNLDFFLNEFMQSITKSIENDFARRDTPAQKDLIDAFLEFRKQKNREVTQDYLKDEDINRGVCLGLTLLWLYCESNASQQYSKKHTPEWFHENYNLLANIATGSIKPKAKIESLTEEQIKNIDEFMGHVLYLHFAPFIAYEYQRRSTFVGASNVRNVEILKEELPLHDLSQQVLDFSDQALPSVKAYLQAQQEAMKECKGEIFLTFMSQDHAMGLKINSNGFNFYDSSTGKPNSNIDDLMKILKSNAEEQLKTGNLQLISLKSYTVGTREEFDHIHHHTASIKAPELDANQLSKADWMECLNFCIISHQNKRIHQLLEGKDDNLIRMAMANSISLTTVNADLFLELAKQHAKIFSDSDHKNKLMAALANNKNSFLIPVLREERIKYLEQSSEKPGRSDPVLLAILGAEIKAAKSNARNILDSFGRSIDKIINVPANQKASLKELIKLIEDNHALNHINLQNIRYGIRGHLKHYQGDRSKVTQLLRGIDATLTNTLKLELEATSYERTGTLAALHSTNTESKEQPSPNLESKTNTPRPHS